MPRAIVTPELTETLRGIRLQNKIQAKNLAAHIGKSPAFISKLESGNIQTIDTKELYSILQFISGENSSTELAEQIYASLRFKYSSKEIEEQLDLSKGLVTRYLKDSEKNLRKDWEVKSNGHTSANTSEKVEVENQPV